MQHTFPTKALIIKPKVVSQDIMVVSYEYFVNQDDDQIRDMADLNLADMPPHHFAPELPLHSEPSDDVLRDHITSRVAIKDVDTTELE